MKLSDAPLRRDAKTGSAVSVREKGKQAHASAVVKQARAARVSAKEDLSNLPTMTASQLKKGGWPGVMAQVNKTAAVAVTNHHRTEAVILTVDHYASLTQRALKPKARAKPAGTSAVSKEIALARLQSAFDQRLAKLKDGKSLAAATSKRARRGKVAIGTSF